MVLGTFFLIFIGCAAHNQRYSRDVASLHFCPGITRTDTLVYLSLISHCYPTQPRSTQPFTFCGMVKWVPATGRWCSATGKVTATVVKGRGKERERAGKERERAGFKQGAVYCCWRVKSRRFTGIFCVELRS